ncbi:hypothetical protein BJ166DRAFT_513198 [Pestalotiopsis sp. NC0098]|nr:hypothetical protein BJ166DRAFT_513198 [Pestalotiopsis sp. NC0098]
MPWWGECLLDGTAVVVALGQHGAGDVLRLAQHDASPGRIGAVEPSALEPMIFFSEMIHHPVDGSLEGSLWSDVAAVIHGLACILASLGSVGSFAAAFRGRDTSAHEPMIFFSEMIHHPVDGSLEVAAVVHGLACILVSLGSVGSVAAAFGGLVPSAHEPMTFFSEMIHHPVCRRGGGRCRPCDHGPHDALHPGSGRCASRTCRCPSGE